MSALNNISKIGRGKLKDLQKIVNIYRPTFIEDREIDSWKMMKAQDRQLKIQVRLSMARLSEIELKEIDNTISPWWEPYWKVLIVLLFTCFVYLIVQVVFFIMAERVYLTQFEQEIKFNKGNSITYDLFNLNTMILSKKENSTYQLKKDNLISWLTNSKESVSFDSASWSKDKYLAKRMQKFYESFKGNTKLIQKLKVYSNCLTPLQILQTVESYLGKGAYKMDVDIPNSYISQCIPFYRQFQVNECSFFCTINEGNTYSNLKINSSNSRVISILPIYYPPKNTWNLKKTIWFENGVFTPKFILIDKNGRSDSKVWNISVRDSIAF